MIKKMKRLITAVLFCSLLLSGCGDSPMSETVTETTTEQTTVTTPKYTEEELEQMVQNMPEIVFVLAFNRDNENIYGYYVTNTGDIKIYDFRQIAPDETYDVPDIYMKLSEATCDKLEPEVYDALFHEEYTIYEEELNDLSKEQITHYYKKLLQIDGSAYYNDNVVPMDYQIGHYRFWGIKNFDDYYELVLLYGDGADYRYDHTDPTAAEMYAEFRPFLPNDLFH